MKLFETTAIKKLIEFQWPIILKYTIIKLLIPYIAFMLAFTGYMHLGIRSVFMTVPLILISLYLLVIEFRGLIRDFSGYFFQVWNYFDIVPPIMIIIYLALDYSGYFDRWSAENPDVDHIKTEQVMMKGVMSLFIWLKLLYFLRVFESTGYLIRSIIHVCISMRHFLLILLLTFIAFGEAIQAVSTADGEGFTGFAGGIGYVYLIVLGGFDVGHFETRGELFLWILFILCTVLVMIIMMNLLIAIVSDAFVEVKEVASQANYRERASIISENLYLVP